MSLFDGAADAPLRRADILCILQNYPSNAEVQYMIDESISKHSQRSIPPLKTCGSTPEGDGGCTPSSSTIDASARHNDPAWLQTLVKTQVEADVSAQLPALIREEVARQVKALQTPAALASSASSSSGRPPIPPTAAGRPFDEAPQTPTTPPDDSSAQRQRERILQAIHDVEHQVNTLQRRVNELLHQHRSTHQRVGQLCLALAPGDVTAATAAQPRDAHGEDAAAAPADNYGPLYDALLDALDNRDTPKARAIISESLAAVLGTSGTHHPARAKGHASLKSPDCSMTERSLLGASPITEAAQQLKALIDVGDQQAGGTSSPPRRPDRRRSSAGSSSALAVSPKEGGSQRRPLRADRQGALSETSGTNKWGRSPTKAAARKREVALGVDAIDLPPGMLPSALGRRGGVRVVDTARGQLADRSGIEADDVILSVCGHVVETCAQLRDSLLAAVSTGGSVPVEVYRHTVHLVFTTTLDV